MTVTVGSSCARGWDCACGHATLSSSVSGVIWHDTVNDCYHFNYASIWLDSNPTCGSGGVGFNIVESWCGFWNNGGGNGNNYLNFGDNFRVSFLFQGFPIYQDYWDPFNVNDSGQHWQSWGQL
jgi:hypothetical protein